MDDTADDALDVSTEGADDERVTVNQVDFGAIYHTHFAFVWRNLRRLGVADHALDDAAQEVFITVHYGLGDFEGRSTLKTWIFGIVVNIVRRHRRTHARRGDHDTIPETLEDLGNPGPLEAAARSEAVRVLHGFLDGLDEGKREAFVLAELEQMTVAEVAAATGTNPNTVASRLRAARQEFERVATRERARDRWNKP